MDNLSAAFTGQEIYVAGGNENGQPCHTFLRLNLANIEKGWEQLPDFPGAARVQPVLAAGESPNGTRIYLAGGFQPILNEEEPIVPTDVWYSTRQLLPGNKRPFFPRLRTERTVP